MASAVQSGDDALQLPGELVEIGRHRRLRGAQLQRERDEASVQSSNQAMRSARPLCCA
jgi:hypothetical protein